MRFYTMHFTNRSVLNIVCFFFLAIVACGDDDDAASSVDTLLPDGYENVEAARFSPDSTRLAMVGSPSGVDDETHLFTTNLDGGDVQVLVTEGLSYLSTIAWMPDDDAIVYGGGAGIMRVGLDGSEPTVVVEDFAVIGLDVSSDGDSVTWSTNGGMSVLSAAISSEPVTGAEHLTGPNGSAPRFHPASSRIAYVTGEGFGISDPDGGNEQEIDASVGYLSNVAWRDDDTLGGLTSFGVETFDTQTGESTEIHEQFAAMSLDISPDGRMFVLSVNGQEGLFLGRF